MRKILIKKTMHKINNEITEKLLIIIIIKLLNNKEKVKILL